MATIPNYPQQTDWRNAFSAWGPAELSQQLNPNMNFATPVTDAANAAPFQMNSLKQGSLYGDYGSGMPAGVSTGTGGGIFGNLFNGDFMKSDFMKGMLGGKDGATGETSNGWGGLALGAANTFMNMKNYGLAQDSFNHNKAMGIANFNNQATLTQDHLNKLNERDRKEAQLNGRSAPGAAPVITRMG